jgi:hypothetical protein
MTCKPNTERDTRPMPRKRVHLTAAERQAAFRARNASRQPPRQRDLAARAKTLCDLVRMAALSGNREAQRLNAENDLDLLDKLTEHFKRVSR